MKSIFSKFASTFFFAGVLIVPSTSWMADMIIDNFTPETNDRFANSASFIGNPYDWSGVGRDNGWGTLIHERVAISAAHAMPSAISFYSGNVPGGANRETVGVISGQQIGNSDLYLAVLARPMPSNFKVYDFAREAISGTPPDGDGNISIEDAGSFQNEIAFMVGRSPTDQGGTIDHGIGQNRITGYTENLPFLGNTDNDAIVLEYDDPGAGDYVFHESRVQSGDSGAPLFVVRNGELLLLGVNAAQLDSDDGSFQSSAITYTGNLATEIDDFLLTVVPEPTALVVLAGACCIRPLRRRRVYNT